MKQDTNPMKWTDAWIESQNSLKWLLSFKALSVSAIVMGVGYYVLMDVSHNAIVSLNVLTLRLRREGESVINDTWGSTL